MYVLMSTRPDITHVVGIVSRFLYQMKVERGRYIGYWAHSYVEKDPNIVVHCVSLFKWRNGQIRVVKRDYFW